MRAGSRKLILTLLGLTFLVLVLHHSRRLIHLQDFSGQRLVAALRETRWEFLLLSVVAIYVCYALRALRWKRFSRYLGPCRFWSVYRMTLAGFASIFLLGRAGEPIRPLLIARKERLPVSGMFGIYLLERLFDTTTTLVLLALALALLPNLGRDLSDPQTIAAMARTTGRTLLILFAALALFIVYFRLHGKAYLEAHLTKWRTRGAVWTRIAGIVSGLSHGLGAIQTFGDLAAGVFYSLSHWLLVALIYVWIPLSFGGSLAETIGYREAIIVLGITMVGSMLQLPGVGGGSQVASFLAFTAVFGVEKEPAAAAAIVLWLITFAACSLAGVPFLIHEGWSIGELRRLAEREESAAEEA
jgi:glycosyltransferase 2 family protein